MHGFRRDGWLWPGSARIVAFAQNGRLTGGPDKRKE
jgi:hypothetical protein